MTNDDLRDDADELEQRLEEGRPDRHQARLAKVGQLLTTGRLLLPESILDYVRARLEEQGDDKSLQDLRLLDDDVLEEQGYRYRDGLLVGPGSWPRGAPPRLGSALSGEGASAGRGGGSGSLAPVLARSEARRHVRVRREYLEWSEGLRKYKHWQESQERRAWVFGQFLGEAIIGLPKSRAIVQQVVREEGKANEVALWSDEDLRADYTANELGEGGGGTHLEQGP